MKDNKRRFSVSSAISALLGLACALVLGGMFYAAMAYQLSGDDLPAQQSAAAQPSPAPFAPGMTAAQLFPGALLGLEGMQPVSERAQDVQMGGRICRVITRSYALEGGGEAEVISAYPAAYLYRMAQEGYTPQLITGFVLAGMDAVYALKEERCALYAREGDCVYAVFMPAGEQEAYALGAAAYLE